MRKRGLGLAAATVATAALALGLAGWRAPASLSPQDLAARLARPLPAPEGALRVYHLGHSLVGREMPVLLTAMAPAGHVSHSQLGWGASLAQHWAGDVPGFAAENAHAAFRPAGEALDSGGYDALVLTEMVELRDAIRWHDSARHLALWAARARAARPEVRLYLYESWHRLDDPAGWAARIAADRPALWEGAVLAPAMAAPGVGTIHIIPAGQVMAAAVAAVEAGAVPGLTSRRDLFSDDIHLTATGAWVVALTHHAVLYHRLPDRLPHRLPHRPADGPDDSLTGGAADHPADHPADRPTGRLPDPGAAPVPAEAEAALRDIVWRTVRADPATGIPARTVPAPAALPAPVAAPLAVPKGT